MARAAKFIRLSRYRTEDPTTSPDVQNKVIDGWLEQEGHTLAVTAEDLDVSAFKVSPFARPESGDVLNYRKGEYDLAVWARLDRAIRNMNDMSDLVRWAKENGKKLVFVRGPGGPPLILDMQSGPMAELIAQIYAFAAQAEAQADSERVTESMAYMRAVGRYAGGWTPFGFRPVPNDAGRGFILDQDPVYAPILKRMIDDALAGMGPTAIADWLNAEGIPTSKDVLRIRRGQTPKGLKWRYPSVLGILRSRAMCGITELDGEIVYRDDGMPVQFAEPIVTLATWQRVQDKIDAISRTVKVPRKDSPWLTGVTLCKVCGGPLYSKRQRNHGKTYDYMRCDSRQHPTRQIRQDDLTAEMDAWIAEHGDQPYMEPRTIEGDNHAAEIATVKLSIMDIGGKATLAETMGEDSETERRRLAQLKARLLRLQQMPSMPDRIVYAQTGMTIAQHWAHLSGAGKHAMLVSHKATVKAERTADGVAIEVNPGTLTTNVAELPVYGRNPLK